MRSKIRRTKGLLIVCALLLLSNRVGSTADDPAAQSSRKISVAYSSISPFMSPAWIAQDMGFFRTNGLNVELIFIESGSRTVQTLVSGDIVAAQVAGAPVIQSNLKGSNIVMIAGLLNTLPYKLMVSRDITRPDQLKGKRLAVSRVGGSSDFATRYALDKYGLVPDKDVQILQIGSQPSRFAALETGQIQGAMISIPLTAQATKAGFNTLADLQMLGLEYQHTSLAMSRNSIRAQPALARSLLKALVESIHFMKTRRRETLSILAKYLRTDDPDELAEVYDAVIIGLVPRKPYPTTKGIHTILREFGAKDAAARTANPEQFVDMTFVKDLDTSGFIDALYKTTTVAARPAEPLPTPMVSQEFTPPPVKVTKAETAEENTKPMPPPVTRTTPIVAEEKTVRRAEPPAENRPPAPVAVASKTNSPEPRYHIVAAGETLSRISAIYYNSINNWPRIYQANRSTVKNPDYIYIGMKLLIPPEISSGG